MHKTSKKFEISITLSSPSSDNSRIVCSSYDKFSDSSYAIFQITEGRQPLPLPANMAFAAEATNAELSLDAVFPSGEFISFQLYKRSSYTSEINKRIKRSETPPESLPERIVFLPDFGGVCVQYEDGAMGSAVNFFLEYTPEDEDLLAIAAEIDAWQGLYEGGINIDRKQNTTFDWEVFHANGIELCEKLQKQLGSRCQVFYRRVTDLKPPNDENSLVVFSPD
jgi:hypothetical protein